MPPPFFFSLNIKTKKIYLVKKMSKDCVEKLIFNGHFKDFIWCNYTSVSFDISRFVIIPVKSRFHVVP